MLAIPSEWQGRPKSPGARDSRDRSTDARDKSPLPRESRKSGKKTTKKHTPSDSEDNDKKRARDKRSSGKHHDSHRKDGGERSHRSSKKHGENASEVESQGESDGEGKTSRRRDSKLKSTKYHYPNPDDQVQSSKSDREASRRQGHDGYESDHHWGKSDRVQKDYDSALLDGSSKWPLTTAPKARDGERGGWSNHPQLDPGYPEYPEYAYARPVQSIQSPTETRNIAYESPREGQRREKSAAESNTERHDLESLSAADRLSYSYPPSGNHPRSSRTDGDDRHEIGAMSQSHHMQMAPYQYAAVDPDIRYRPRPEKNLLPHPQPVQPISPTAYTQDSYPQDVELHRSSSQKGGEELGGTYRYESRTSTKELKPRLERLSISPNAALGGGLAAAAAYENGRLPRSPVLESYRGTYQSISPMPSPISLAKDKPKDADSSDPSDLDLPSRRSKSSKRDKKGKRDEAALEIVHHKHNSSNASAPLPDIVVATPRTPKRVSFYDPSPDAQKIAAALTGTHNLPDTYPLLGILPSLSTDDILALRTEYKKHAKTSGKGINMAKHIKMRVPGNLGKAAYATALGRWESEAYWANMWYQSGGSRRELLIESLMGRSNSDIREIKNCFRDKRYGDDLETCMKAELKADKFRLAILLALEEDRMPDTAPLDVELVKQDVRDLYRALTVSREQSGGGGETVMIYIIVLRSDNHLREVLGGFESAYHLNFAREMICRSRNLVGETLAHILNGALNRPMRDALLLHQAMTETAPGRERAELLISRTVRLHWEFRHMEHVKRVYRERYRVDVGTALRREVWRPTVKKSPDDVEWIQFVAGCLRVDLGLDEGRSRHAGGYEDEFRHDSGRGHGRDDLDGQDRRRGSSRRRRKSRRSSEGKDSELEVDEHQTSRRSAGEAEVITEMESHEERRRRRGGGRQRGDDYNDGEERRPT